MNDCDLYGHPNVSGAGCPCGRVVRLPLPPPAPVVFPTPLPPVLAVIRGDAQRPKAKLRTHYSSLRRPQVWA